MRAAACILLIVMFGCKSAPSARQAAGPAPASPGPGARTVQIALNWFPEAEHGGFYAALVHGFYGKEGLQVEILGGGPDAPVIQRVASGQVTFGVANADDVLLARAEEAPVIAVLAPIQNSPRCVIVHRSIGIKRLQDLKDLTLSLSPRAAFSHYLRATLPLTGVEIVPYNLPRFLVEDRYAVQGYVFSEPYTLRMQGADPVALMVSDLGFNPYTSVLITTERVVREQPELVRKVVRASVQGWREYLQSPAQTNQHIHQINPEMGLEILNYGVQALKPLALTEQAQVDGIGIMTAERWGRLLSQLEEIKLIKPGTVRAEEAFTTEFLTGLSGQRKGL